MIIYTRHWLFALEKRHQKWQNAHLFDSLISFKSHYLFYTCPICTAPPTRLLNQSMCSILVARVTQYKKIGMLICSYNEKWECIIHYSECSTKHTTNLSKICKIHVYFLPNLINEMFICQKTSHVSNPTGMGPKLSVMNTIGHFLHGCWHFLRRFSHQFTSIFSRGIRCPACIHINE